MIQYTLRRLAILPPALVLFNFLGFAFAHLVRPIQASQNPYAMLQMAGLSTWRAYGAYLQGIVHGDFGLVPPANVPVEQVIQQSGLASMGLLALALLFSIVIGLALGLNAARTEPAGIKGWSTVVTTVGLASPSFFVGILLITLSIAYLIWGPGEQALVPFQGFGWDLHLVLPTLALMIRPTVQIAQVTSGLLAEELGKQYVVTARSFGHTWRTIRRRHTFSNILAPVIVSISGSVRLLAAELIIIERLFGWPGIGRLLSETLVSTSRSPVFLDPQLLAALVTVLAAFFLIVDLIASILVRAVDPRLRAA